MEDLISREAAIRKIVNLKEFDEGGWDINVPAIKLEDLEELPAVDAEPVRHGRWVFEDADVIWWWKCSECHSGEMYKTPFCPNCGAKMMDLEDGND